MKSFTWEETRFSLCGLNSALCSMHLGGVFLRRKKA